MFMDLFGGGGPPDLDSLLQLIGGGAPKDESRLPQGIPQQAIPFTEPDIAPREPVNVPLPQARPPDLGGGGMPMQPPMQPPVMEPMMPPGTPMGGAAPAPQGMMESLKAGGGGGGLLSAILGMSPDASRGLGNAIAGGFKAPSSPFKGGAVMSGAGGAIEGRNKGDDEEYARQLKALELVIKSRTAGSQEEFNQARADYYRKYGDVRQQDADTRAVTSSDRTRTVDTLNGIRQQNADTNRLNADNRGANYTRTGDIQQQNADTRRLGAGARQQDADTRRQNADRLNSPTSRPREKTIIELDRREQQWRKEATTLIEQVNKDYSLKPDERKAKVQQIETRRDQQIERLRSQLGVDGGAPSPARAPPAPRQAPTEPPKIQMEGGGAKVDPYKPVTQEDYDEMEPGTYYIHPGDGKLKMKK